MAQEQPGSAGATGGQVRVAIRDLAQAGQQVRAQALNLENQVINPLNTVETSHGATWTSGSHAEYLRVHQGLVASLGQAQQTTHHMGATMEQSAGAYGVLNQTRFNNAPGLPGDGADPFDTIRVAGNKKIPPALLRPASTQVIPGKGSPSQALQDHTKLVAALQNDIFKKKINGTAGGLVIEGTLNGQPITGQPPAGLQWDLAKWNDPNDPMHNWLFAGTKPPETSHAEVQAIEGSARQYLSSLPPGSTGDVTMNVVVENAPCPGYCSQKFLGQIPTQVGMQNGQPLYANSWQEALQYWATGSFQPQPGGLAVKLRMWRHLDDGTLAEYP